MEVEQKMLTENRRAVDLPPESKHHTDTSLLWRNDERLKEFNKNQQVD